MIVADPTVPGSLAGLLDEHHAVISALGARDRGPTTVYSAGATEIIAAMPPGGRLLVVSSAGLDIPSDAGPATRFLARALHRIMRYTYTDMARMEQLLAHSELRWTAIRPTRLTDGPATSRPRILWVRTRKPAREHHEPTWRATYSTPSTTRGPTAPRWRFRPDLVSSTLLAIPAARRCTCARIRWS